MAAAASALDTWWAPCNRSATSALPPGISSRNEARPRSSRRMSPARTAAAVSRTPNVTTRAAVRAAIASTRGSSAFSTATPSAGQRLGQFALRLRHRVKRAELPGVRPADVQHRADARRRDVAQRGDVPDAAGGHLQHQEAGRGVGAQHGQRQADLVVERALGGDGRPEVLHHLSREVLGRGLARRPGDPGDGGGGQPAEHPLGQRAERDGHVGDDDRRARRAPAGRRAPRPPRRRPRRARSRGRPRARRAAPRTARRGSRAGSR